MVFPPSPRVQGPPAAAAEPASRLSRRPMFRGVAWEAKLPAPWDPCSRFAGDFLRVPREVKATEAEDPQASHRGSGTNNRTGHSTRRSASFRQGFDAGAAQNLRVVPVLVRIRAADAL